MQESDDLRPPPSTPITKILILKVVDAEVYAELVEQGYWIGFEMPVPVRGGN